MRLTTKAALAAMLVLAGAVASGPALAGRSSFNFGLSFGYPGWYGPGPWYYAPPVYPYYDPYYYPAYGYPAYGYPAGPTVYVEQSPQPAAAPAPAQGQWWYYCAESKAYYPYVRECPGSWQRVAPTPPPGS